MKRLIAFGLLVTLAALGAFAFPPPLSAQTMKAANFTYRYNLDSTDLIYCHVLGSGGSPFGSPMPGKATIKTVGSSLTVTENSSGTNPFDLIGVGDVLFVTLASGSVQKRVVATRASASSITVDTVIDLTGGFSFRWLDTQCGTTDEDGWIETAGMTSKKLEFLLQQISGVVGGISIRLECRGDALGSLPVIVHPGDSASATCSPGTLASEFCNFTVGDATDGRSIFTIPQDILCGEARIGMKIVTSDAAEAAEANRERITSTLESAGIRQ